MKNVEFSLLSDDQIMELYQGLQRGMITLAQQTYLAYWIEEGTVEGIDGDKLAAWALEGTRWAEKTLKTRVDLRALLMDSRPNLFENHRRDYLESYDVQSTYLWNQRPTAKKYEEIVEKREKAQYKRGK